MYRTAAGRYARPIYNSFFIVPSFLAICFFFSSILLFGRDISFGQNHCSNSRSRRSGNSRMVYRQTFLYVHIVFHYVSWSQSFIYRSTPGTLFISFLSRSIIVSILPFVYSFQCAVVAVVPRRYNDIFWQDTNSASFWNMQPCYRWNEKKGNYADK